MYDAPAQHAFLAHKFTGKERDSESGLDNFGARYFAPTQGRFTSPDPGNAGAFTAPVSSTTPATVPASATTSTISTATLLLKSIPAERQRMDGTSRTG